MGGKHLYDVGVSIMRREVLHGRLRMEHPVKVIADDGEQLAVLLEPPLAMRRVVDPSIHTASEHTLTGTWAGQEEPRGRRHGRTGAGAVGS